MALLSLALVGCDALFSTSGGQEEKPKPAMLIIAGTAYSEEDGSPIAGISVTLTQRKEDPIMGCCTDIKEIAEVKTQTYGKYKITAFVGGLDCLLDTFVLSARKQVGDSLAYYLSVPTYTSLFSRGIYVGCSEDTLQVDLPMKKPDPILLDTNFTMQVWAGSYYRGDTDGDTSNAQFNKPSGIVADQDGNLFVADLVNHKIKKITPGGMVSTYAGGRRGYKDGNVEEAQFSYPSDIALAQDGSLFIVDRSNNRIRKITPQGEVTTLAGNGNRGDRDGTGNEAEFMNLKSIVVNSNGVIFLSTGSRSIKEAPQKIKKITADGEVTTIAGGAFAGFRDGPGDKALFSGPSGLALGPDEQYLYVADKGNHVVRMIDLATAEVSTFAGLVGSDGHRDGDPEEAKFDFPSSLAIDQYGNLYVGNVSLGSRGELRKITAAGKVRTIISQNFIDMTFDPNGDLYFTREHLIGRITFE
ncbi:hypothetical protein NC796_07010 [Aliifodinibius sp. S!AR15-10]|nr:hypothetical protein [Aliifodinibius sp. S!AR15-10]